MLLLTIIDIHFCREKYFAISQTSWIFVTSESRNQEKLECLQEWHIQYHIRTIVLSDRDQVRT